MTPRNDNVLWVVLNDLAKPRCWYLIIAGSLLESLPRKSSTSTPNQCEWIAPKISGLVQISGHQYDCNSPCYCHELQLFKSEHLWSRNHEISSIPKCLEKKMDTTGSFIACRMKMLTAIGMCLLATIVGMGWDKTTSRILHFDVTNNVVDPKGILSLDLHHVSLFQTIGIDVSTSHDSIFAD